MLPKIVLKQGRDAAVKRRHPWIFSGAIASEPVVDPGSVVQVVAANKEVLGFGYYNPQSQIRVRLLDWTEATILPANLWADKITAAVDYRVRLGLIRPLEACRIINAEADGLPGLIVDKYADVLVIQSMTAGIDRFFEPILDVLQEALQPRAIFERSDDQSRELEGLKMRSGIVRGSLDQTVITCEQDGQKFVVDIAQGHKTGTYLDQRDTRSILRPFFAGKRVLNCFSYTGAFTVAALAAGASEVVSVDASQPALDNLSDNLRLNGLDQLPHTEICANVFEYLRGQRDRAAKYDFIILDPPKFAHNASQVDKAARGYKDLNRLAFGLLNSGGWLATFSCSGHISSDLFQKIIFSGVLESGGDAHIARTLQQAADHPTLLTFPESGYLKGLLCHKV